MLQLYSEPQGTGGFLAEGVRKLLGSPPIEQHAILMRECVQNSWDARLAGSSPYFSADVRPLSSVQKRVLKHGVLVDSGMTGECIGKFLLEDQDSWVIELSDRGTTGLTGNIDPRIATAEGEPKNFANLVFTYGATRNTGSTGGTYGYGKVAAFGSSDLGTVIYWTRCEHNGKLEYRLIASRLGDEVEIDGLSYTGRHWWGRLDPQANVLPLVGEEARILGEQIFNQGFSDGETGTSIMVLKPVIPNTESDHEGNIPSLNSMRELAESIRDSVLENLWPKVTPRPDGTVPMVIQIKYQSEILEFGNPAVGLWKVWADALNAVRRGEHGDGAEGPNVERWAISFKSQSRHQPEGFRDIGNFAISKGLGVQLPFNFDRLFQDRIGTYCRMRAPELVVDYMPLPGFGDSDSYFAGVFKVLDDPDANAAFAEAEGPTHSEWNSATKSPTVKSMIRTAMQRITDTSKEYFSELLPQPDTGPKFNGKIANRLRYLVPVGSSIEQQPNRKKKRVGARAKVLSPTLEALQFVKFDERGFQVQLATVRTPEAEGKVPVKMTVQRVGGGTDDDIGSEELEVNWLDRSNEVIASGTRVNLKGESRYQARIATVGAYRLRIRVGADK